MFLHVLESLPEVVVEEDICVAAAVPSQECAVELSGALFLL